MSSSMTNSANEGFLRRLKPAFEHRGNIYGLTPVPFEMTSATGWLNIGEIAEEHQWDPDEKDTSAANYISPQIISEHLLSRPINDEEKVKKGQELPPLVYDLQNSGEHRTLLVENQIGIPADRTHQTGVFRQVTVLQVFDNTSASQIRYGKAHVGYTYVYQTGRENLLFNAIGSNGCPITLYEATLKANSHIFIDRGTLEHPVKPKTNHYGWFRDTSLEKTLYLVDDYDRPFINDKSVWTTLSRVNLQPSLETSPEWRKAAGLPPAYEAKSEGNKGQ